MTNEHDEQDEAKTDSRDVGPDSGPPPPALAVPHSDEHRQDVPAPPEAHGFTQGQAERFATSYLGSPSAIPTPEEEAQYLVGGYDANMDAAHWFSLFDVDPDKAAMVLCQLNPNTDTDPDWPAENTTTDQTGPRDLLKLRQRFKDLSRAKPRPRTLRDWLHEAKEMQERYHSWIDEYVDAVALTPDASPGPPASAAPATQAAPPAAGETATIEPAAAGATAVVRHLTNEAPRRDILDPVIELAQRKCHDPKDTAQVLAQLQVMAHEEHPPLLASTTDGIKYTKKGEPAYLTRDALNKRLHPEKRQKRR